MQTGIYMWRVGDRSKLSELNFTNRRLIPRENLKIQDLSTPSQNQFMVRELELGSFGFPSDARIWLSAQRSYAYQRFDLGSPTQPSTGVPHRLDAFDTDGLTGIRFRLLVIEPNGKIIGATRPFRESTLGQHSSPLLDMSSRDIGDEIWKLDFDEEGGPLLLINSKISDPQAVTDSPLFITLVLPMLLKLVAEWLMTSELDDNPELSPAKWLRYFRNLGIEINYEPDRKLEDIHEIADEAARLFASRHDLLATYFQHAEGSGK